MLVNTLMINRLLFGKTYAAYCYELRYGLEKGHPRGIKGDKPALEPTLNSITALDDGMVITRGFIWLPLKLYFYYASMIFAN